MSICHRVGTGNREHGRYLGFSSSTILAILNLKLKCNFQLKSPNGLGDDKIAAMAAVLDFQLAQF